MSTNNENPDLEALTKSFLDIVIECWRFEKLFDRLLQKLESRRTSQVSWTNSLVP